MTARAWPVEDDLVEFWCPGCKTNAGHRIRPGDWSFNEDFERPTISPSILVQWGNGQVCHSFVTDGRIQFLGDCTHALAGQTVDLPGRPA